eukprot:10896909-Alexandrium_andersonii.AAC.1
MCIRDSPPRHACAESYGIAHAAGLSRYIVHWMQHGEPPYELTETDPALSLIHISEPTRLALI